MLKYIRKIVFLALFILPLETLAQESGELGFINGIWQSYGSPEQPEARNEYYSLHYDGETLILISLAFLEYTRNTLMSTFAGTGFTRDFSLEGLDFDPLIPHTGGKHNLNVSFTSDTEASVTAVFDSPIVDGAHFIIRKIFQ
ncbi:MAG: hypothetical protein KF908_02155 [Nitrosomonas sp.]|nr:hypothetical protein [Nitrosomonas sp.]MCW5606861.1 hypothetical protein [Nitrosomonas sp.]